MIETKRWSWKRRVVAIVLGAAAVSIILAVVLLTGGSSSGPSASDEAGMQTTIANLWSAKDAALAPQTGTYAQYAASATVPQSVYNDISATYQNALQAVGTPEFISAHVSAGGSPTTAAAAMRGVGDVETQSESQVLSVDYQRTLSNGDVVLWVKIWLGDVRQHYASGTVGVGASTTVYVDNTPTYQYQMRDVDGQWKIVAEAVVYDSEDSAGGQSDFGPNTPHSTSASPLVSGDQGLVIATPSPAPSAS
jgi:hypothetical protein